METDSPPIDIEAVSVGGQVVFQDNAVGEWMYASDEAVIALDDAV